MKRILGLIGLVLLGNYLQAQSLLNQGATIYVAETGVLNVYGNGTVPACSLAVQNNGLINNDGQIYLTGDFVNNNATANPFDYPKTSFGTDRSVLKMWGKGIQKFLGNPSRFNNLHLFHEDNAAFLAPKVQFTDAYIDVTNKLTIDQTELSGCDGSTPRGFAMIVFNPNPNAIEALNDGFVSAENDASNSDAFVPTYRGGRLVWYTQDNPEAEYIFPVGNKNLPSYRRDVTIKTRLTEQRKVMVRCVGRNPEDDNYVFERGTDPFVCKLNERFYHIIDDSTKIREDDPNRNFFVRINYLQSDGQFNDIGQCDLLDRNIAWNALESEAGDSGPYKNFTKEEWNDYTYPVFALYATRALDGLTLENKTNPGSTVFRVKDRIDLKDNDDNKPGLEYKWTMYYEGNPPNKEVVGTSSNRYATYPIDFGIAEAPPSLKPGKYCFELNIKNPAINDPDCEVVDSQCVFLLPSRAAYVPNAFSPNNDATNQDLTAWFYGFKEITIDIYNRWGNKIYSKGFKKEDTPGLDNVIGVPVWNGKTDDGDPVPEGMYVYRLRMFVDETVEEFPGGGNGGGSGMGELEKVWESNGNITVIR